MDSHNRNAKRQELSGELHTDHQKRDRISYLPNAVLCMILSFLPTNFSLATSVLSKRWNNVATADLSNLDFDADLMVHNHQGDMGVYAHKMKCFEESVNHVLSLTDGKNLERFRISWFQEAAISCMYSWVAAVVVYNLREIDLSSSFCHSIHLPSRLFGCKTLVLLKLRGGFIIDLPTHVTLPNLTTLLLDSVTYLGDISLEKLISSCIVLEELHIVRQNWDGVQVVNIFALSLKRLSLWFSLFHDQDNNIHGYKTCITAPNLEYLELNDHITLDYAIDSMPLLVEARVDAHLRQMCGHIGYAKTISLHGCSILSLKKSSNMCLFYSVTHLELGITEIDAWDWLIRLLGGTPFLQVLVFPEGLVKHDSKPCYHRRRKGTSTTSMIKWNPPQTLPGLPSSLEEVVIREFKGVENEMDLVMYLLDQARALKQITIYFDLDEEDDSNSRMEMVTEEILQYPRRSAACQINFIG